MLSAPVIYLNSNEGKSLLAFGEGPVLRVDTVPALDRLQDFLDTHTGKFRFLCLNYNLKNEIEDLQSCHPDRVGFPMVLCGVPACVVEIDGNSVTYLQGHETRETREFIARFLQQKDSARYTPLTARLEPVTPKTAYLRHVGQLLHELQQGTIYEVNYCQEYVAENVKLDNPEATYFALNEITGAPYSAYVQWDEFRVFSGSPECFLSLRGNTLRSYPIKGTHRRGNNPEEDDLFRETLRNDTKERSENVMIVDLVRNDLSRVAEKGSVRVEELFGIYSFPTVHQMISTVACELKQDVSFQDILRATFPMGSMTGAPKISAMQFIEQHEDFSRGLYSGSVGFMAPNGDFDLNVIIRTLQYNTKRQVLSCAVGSAITIASNPEKEYEECEVKIMGMLRHLYAES